jgi:hypothetical protein
MFIRTKIECSKHPLKALVKKCYTLAKEQWRAEGNDEAGLEKHLTKLSRGSGHSVPALFITSAEGARLLFGVLGNSPKPQRHQARHFEDQIINSMGWSKSQVVATREAADRIEV